MPTQHRNGSEYCEVGGAKTHTRNPPTKTREKPNHNQKEISPKDKISKQVSGKAILFQFKTFIVNKLH